MMDDSLINELGEMLENVETAEVISLFFPGFRKAVIIDTRESATEGPMVCIMAMAASPQERLKVIRRVRPGFPKPLTLTLIPWPRYVESLIRLGIWECIVNRFLESGHDQVAATCYTILDELRRLEKSGLASVVRGENYHTLWSSDQ